MCILGLLGMLLPYSDRQGVLSWTGYNHFELLSNLSFGVLDSFYHHNCRRSYSISFSFAGLLLAYRRWESPCVYFYGQLTGTGKQG